MVVCGGLRWFVVVCGGLWWFVVDCGGLSFSHTAVSCVTITCIIAHFLLSLICLYLRGGENEV